MKDTQIVSEDQQLSVDTTWHIVSNTEFRTHPRQLNQVIYMHSQHWQALV